MFPCPVLAQAYTEATRKWHPHWRREAFEKRAWDRDIDLDAPTFSALINSQKRLMNDRPCRRRASDHRTSSLVGPKNENTWNTDQVE